MEKIFLLSPANLSGLRARQLISPRARFPAALAYQSADGVRIDQAMAFMSALYFRGKIAYAQRFAQPGPSMEGSGIFIITPGFGLVPPDWRIDAQRIRKLRKTPVDIRNRSYSRPLMDAAQTLSAQLSADGLAVLLGSVATGKYVDLLWPLFGDRLRFPRRFAGIGDMSRGAMMLRAAQSGEELEYVTLDVDRHRPKGTRERDLSGLNPTSG